MSEENNEAGPQTVSDLVDELNDVITKLTVQGFQVEVDVINNNFIGLRHSVPYISLNLREVKNTPTQEIVLSDLPLLKSQDERISDVLVAIDGVWGDLMTDEQLKAFNDAVKAVIKATW